MRMLLAEHDGEKYEIQGFECLDMTPSRSTYMRGQRHVLHVPLLISYSIYYAASIIIILPPRNRIVPLAA